LNTLYLVGLGLSARGISTEARELLPKCGTIFIENYTSTIPGLDAASLCLDTGVEPLPLPRQDVEGARPILDALDSGDVALLIPGDPMISTTHISLRVQAARAGHGTRVIHGTSIISAVMGESCLQATRFGRFAAISFLPSRQPYDVLSSNLRLGLHTILLLDLDAEGGRHMSVPEGLEALLATERNIHDGVIRRGTLAIGLARVGQPDQFIAAGPVDALLTMEFGGPPQSIVIPGKLHFAEEEALQVLLGYAASGR
jgi:diphthine synthase